MTRSLIVGLALMAAACSGADTASDTASDSAPVALVKLAPASLGSGVDQITVYGAAEPGPEGKMSLVAPAEAKVVAIVAPAGTKVGQGQVIVRLSASPTTRADGAKAAADAAAANKALARTTRLRADGLMSDADVETARAAAAAANALQASFASKAGGLTLRAPAAGNVETVSVAPGDLLQPGAAVATVARVGDVRVRFSVDPDTARTLRPGMALNIVGDASRAPLTVRIESIGAVVDPQTKNTAVFARIPAAAGIVSGETLTATIEAGATANALTIPYAALLDDGGQPYAYVVAGGVAHRRDLAIKPSGGDRVIVTRGLKPGEQVVVEGGTAVEDGMKVRTK